MNKCTALTTILIILIFMLIPYISFGQVPSPPKTEEINSLLQSDSLLKALSRCFTTSPVPLKLKAEIIFETDGSLHLINLIPSLPREEFKCISDTLINMTLHPLDKKYRLIYNFSFKKTLPASFTESTETSEQGETTEKLKDNLDIFKWKKEYSRGMGTLIAGVSLSTILGITSLVTGSILFSKKSSSISWDEYHILSAVSIASGVFGILIMIPSSITAIATIRRALEKKHKYFVQLEKVSMLPDYQTLYIASTFRF